MSANELPITALLISPDRELGVAFLRAAAAERYFQVISDAKSYMSEQVLEMRLRQLKPEAVVLDLKTDIEQACETIRLLLSRSCPVQVIGIHTTQDGPSIVRSLRAGAAEFLWEPFEASAQQTAFDRISRLRTAGAAEENENGRVYAFSSTKPGSGATTVAVQGAFSLQRVSQKKILLIDADLMGGAIGFYLKCKCPASVIDLLRADGFSGGDDWEQFTVNVDGVDILAAPDEPFVDALDAGRLQQILDLARRRYQYVFVDLPTVFHRNALLALSSSDSACLVTTAELPSLHLTRKAVELLDTVGFEKSRYRIVVNRLGKKDGIAPADVEKMFGAAVKAILPNDYFSLHRVVTRGGALSSESELGRSIETAVGRMAGISVEPQRRARKFWDIRSPFAQHGAA
jgi:pilus assembly protein CpaE